MTIQPQQAAGLQQNPYLPEGSVEPLVFEEFAGINTATQRAGVPDKQMAWCDGWMPLAPRNLRTMPDVGPAFYTVTAGLSVVFFGFANIGPRPIEIIFLSDGSIVQKTTDTAVTTQIAPAGTIINPSRLTVGFTQWGSQYVIITSSQQTNGYWIWDGTVFYGAGGIAPLVTITNNGTGYTSQPLITATGGSGSGATFTAAIANGLVTGITVVNPGTGYLAGDTVTLTITGGGGVSAAATVTLMPFAIAGNAVETYSGHVWVVNGPNLAWTAPGSVSDFATSNGGGSLTSSNSSLRVRYTALLATNGFLYLTGDSSLSYISNVQTTGTPPVTTFSLIVADPEVGTPWGATVTTFGRNIVFANPFGAHVTYGGAVNKISEELDGVYNTVPNFAGFNPSSAKAIIFAKKVWMFLLPIIDPITESQVNKIILWNGKLWWTTPQGVNIIYIAHQEINSVLTAWGTDGTSIYPLFQQASNLFSKVVQSRFWTSPGGYQFIKASTRLWALFAFKQPNSILFDVSIDSEFGASSSTYASGSHVINVVNASGTIILTKNALLVTIPAVSFFSGSYVLPPAAVGQQGALTGMTITTTEGDISLISAMLQDEIAAYRG